MSTELLKSVEARVLKVKRMGANVHVEGMIADIRSAHDEATVSWLERAILRESRRQGVPVEFRGIEPSGEGNSVMADSASPTSSDDEPSRSSSQD